MKVLALSGSLREEAFSTRLVEAAADVAPEGVEISRYERLDEIPGFNQDLESEVSEVVEDLRTKIDAADALLMEAGALSRRLSLEPATIPDATGMLRMRRGELDTAAVRQVRRIVRGEDGAFLAIGDAVPEMMPGHVPTTEQGS